jgi:hypothetical protein
VMRQLLKGLFAKFIENFTHSIGPVIPLFSSKQKDRRW